MHLAVAEWRGFAKQHIAEETLQEDSRFRYSFLQIAVVGTNQRIAEIPGVSGKEVIGYFEAQRLQVFNHKDSRTTGVALAKSMYLPEVGTETCQVPDDFIDAFKTLTIVPFLSHVILQCLTDGIGTGIIDRFTSQHPFPLGDVIVTNESCKFIDTLEQTPMNGR